MWRLCSQLAGRCSTYISHLAIYQPIFIVQLIDSNLASAIYQATTRIQQEALY